MNKRAAIDDKMIILDYHFNEIVRFRKKEGQEYTCSEKKY